MVLFLYTQLQYTIEIYSVNRNKGLQSFQLLLDGEEKTYLMDSEMLIALQKISTG